MFIFNFKQTGLTPMYVDDMLVLPVSMIAEGVLNDSLLLMENLKENIESWNGRPIVINHPTDNEGNEVAACHPDQYKFHVGHVFNTRIHQDKLIAEAWFDLEKIQANDKELAAMLPVKPIELSTGYFADEVIRTGEFEGKKFQKIHKNIRPDHLAILTKGIGACSLADGCGTLTNKEKNMPRKVKDKECKHCEELQKLVTNGRLTKEQYEKLNGMAKSVGSENMANLTNILVAEVYDAPSMDTIIGILSDLTAKSAKKEKPKTNSDNSDGGDNMDGKDKTDVKDDEVVKTNNNDPKVDDKVKTKDDAQDVQKIDMNEMVNNIATAVEAKLSKTIVNELPKYMKEANRKTDLVSRIKTNSDFTDSELYEMDIAVLEKMAKMSRPQSDESIFSTNVSTNSAPLLPPRLRRTDKENK